jgi:uncharacterized protein YjbI with pentapeptide repeats
MLDPRSVGGKIAEARKRIHFSQAELAHHVSISPQAVGKWERGESMPDITTLNRLAEVLSVDLNYFSDSFPATQAGMASFEALNEGKGESPTQEPERKLDWNWDMSQGNWKDADFSGLKNLKEKFSSAHVKSCQFMGSDLSGLILEKNNIELCDFSNSNIRDSKIRSSNLLNNVFNGCSFIDTELIKSNIQQCNFSGSDLSGAEIVGSSVESNDVSNVVWKFTKFLETSITHMTFTGTLEDCHFERCTFHGVKFENAKILNTFFKYNERFKKVQFVNCTVDSISFAFLKNNQANLAGITVME